MTHQPVFNVYKPQGKTPLELVRLLRQQYSIPQTIPLGYAGRLDPLADGVLLILAGDENKRRKEYELLKKTYDATILFGIATDTYDILGVIKKILPVSSISTQELKNCLDSKTGTYTQSYPPYSSVLVKGKPLYYWARKNQLDKVTIPQKTITIDKISLNTIDQFSLKEFFPKIISRIQDVHGDFRQSQIIETWVSLFDKHPHYSSWIADISVECSSGTYIRELIHTIGVDASIPTLAFSITRTSVGSFSQSNAIHLL